MHTPYQKKKLRLSQINKDIFSNKPFHIRNAERCLQAEIKEHWTVIQIHTKKEHWLKIAT